MFNLKGCSNFILSLMSGPPDNSEVVPTIINHIYCILQLLLKKKGQTFSTWIGMFWSK